MAKKDEGPKIVLERTYNVPLRKEWLKAPRWKRSKKAVKALREFLQKHMKSNEVKLGRFANELIWKHGGKNPPHHVKVTAKKDDEGVVTAELEGIKVEAPKAPEDKKKDDKKEEEKKPEEKKDDSKKEEVKEEKKEEAPKEEEKKVEVKEVPKKEEPKPAKKVETPEEKEKVAELAKQIMSKGSTK